MSLPKSLDIKVTSIGPEIISRRPDRVTCTFDQNTPVCLINTLRRILLSNVIPVKHLTLESSDIDTSDKYVVPEYLIPTLEMLPVDQNIPADSTFSINIENKNAGPIEITSTHLDKTGKYFDLGYVFTSLNPKRYIKISNIRVKTSRHNARYSLACQVFAGENYITGKKELMFSTWGSMPGKAVLIKSIEMAISMFSSVKSVVPNVTSLQKEDTVFHELTIMGETSTISVPIVFMMNNMLKNEIDATSFDPIDQKMTIIKFNTNNDPKETLMEAIDALIEYYQALLKLVK